MNAIQPIYGNYVGSGSWHDSTGTMMAYRVDVGGTAIGNGYIFDGYCHYNMKAGEAFVEASYRPTIDGLEVFGSSSRNANGNYIAWKEALRRTA